MNSIFVKAITASVLLAAFNISINTAYANSTGIELGTNTTLEEIFQSFKKSQTSYEDKGVICEQVAKYLLEKKYPAPRYRVEVGIAYGDLDNTIGELDEVIFDNVENKAIQVLEVKCWADLKAGQEKAMNQRTRFLKNIRSNKELYFFSTSTQEEFDQKLFEGISDFRSIGQKGATASGFDFEFPFTMKELMDLRVRLVRCQSWGEKFCN